MKADFMTDQSSGSLNLESRDGYRRDSSYAKGDFGTEEEAAATAADEIDNGSNEEEDILRAVLDTWKMIKRKARRNLFIIGFVTTIVGGFLISAGVFLFACLELFYRTTVYPMYLISVSMVVTFIGMQCVSVCDVDMDAMLKAHPFYAKLHVSALLVVPLFLAVSLGNAMLISTIPSLYFMARFSKVVALEPGYPRVTELTTYGSILIQLGWGYVFASWALARYMRVDYYHCWCALPYLQQRGIFDRFEIEGGVTLSEVGPHAVTSCCFIAGSVLTGAFELLGKARRHTPTRRLMLSAYLLLFNIGLSFFISFASIHLGLASKGYSVPWGSRFQYRFWPLAPLLIMVLCITQTR
jgi:hypothetical protein